MLCSTKYVLTKKCCQYTYIHAYIYIYIYIYIYLLTYDRPAFTVARKKEKKSPASRDNNNSNYPHSGGKRKNIMGQKKKEKANFVTPVEKNQEICNQSVKRKRRPAVKCCIATITESAQYKVEPITNIKSRVGPILLKFRLTGSSGNLVPTRY